MVKNHFSNISPTSNSDQNQKSDLFYSQNYVFHWVPNRLKQEETPKWGVWWRTSKNTKQRKEERERETWMVLTGALFKRFKCLATSSFCLETLSLAAEDREMNTPHKQKTRRIVTAQLPLEPIFQKMHLQPSTSKLIPLKTFEEWTCTLSPSSPKKNSNGDSQLA